MIKHIWSVLCEDSSIDQNTNKLSIRNILENVELGLDRKKPMPDKLAIPINFEIISFFTRTDRSKEEKIRIKTKLLNPKMDQLGEELKAEIRFPKGADKLRSRLVLQGLPVKGAGRYVFVVSFKIDEAKDFQTAAELPLDVKFLK